MPGPPDHPGDLGPDGGDHEGTGREPDPEGSGREGSDHDALLPDDRGDNPDPEAADGCSRAAEVATDADRDAARQDQLVDYAHRLGPDTRLAELDDDELEASVRSGASALAAATCQWLTLLAELVVRGVWAVDGASSPAAWLSWAVGQAPSTAREHVRVALRLRDCPQVRERFAAGTISYSKVRAITRICDPSTEEMLLRWADAAPAAALERICADARRLQRAAAPSRERDDLGLTRRWRDDGALEVVLVLDAANGIAFEQRLDRLAELDDGTGDGTAVAVAGDRVDGTGAPRQATDPVGGVDDTATADSTTATSGRVPRRRRMADLVLGALGSAVDRAPTDASGEDRHLVVLHAPAEALAASADGPVLVQDGRGRTRLLPAGALAESACSATLGGVLDPPRRSPVIDTVAPEDEPAESEDDPEDEPPTGSDTHGEGVPSDGVHAIDGPDAPNDHPDDCSDDVQPAPPRSLAHPADLGRRRRQPSMPLRRALRMRDRSCRFPGCDATLFLHAHHVVFWSRGGRTDMANLVLLCRYHHHVVHDDGWLLRPDGPGRWSFHRTDQAPAARWSEPLGGDSAGGVQAVLSANRHLADPRALLPGDWDGDEHDHDLVMQVLATALGLAA